MANESDALDALEKEAKEYDKVCSPEYRCWSNVIVNLMLGC